MFGIIKALIPLCVQIYKLYKRYYDRLPPEKKAKLDAAGKKNCQDYNGMSTGVGE